MTRLGENARPPLASAPAGIPTNRRRMEEKIMALLPEAGSSVILRGAPHQLGGAESLRLAATMIRLPCGLYAATLPLPEDFLRLVRLRMASWAVGVGSAIGEGSGEWRRRWSAEPSIAGSPASPAAYLEAGDEGPTLIASGSDTEEDRVAECLIWRVPRADGEGNFRFPAALLPDLASELSSRLK